MHCVCVCVYYSNENLGVILLNCREKNGYKIGLVFLMWNTVSIFFFVLRNVLERYSLFEPHFHLYLALSTCNPCNHMIQMLISGVRQTGGPDSSCSLWLVSHIFCLQFILVSILTGYSIHTAYVSMFMSLFLLPMKMWSKCTFINRIFWYISSLQET